MTKKNVKISKFLSYVLRHKPHEIGLKLDNEGWAKVDELIVSAARHGTRLNHELIKEVVNTNDKKRFTLSGDGTRIRANQGHSIKVDLGLKVTKPPEYLYHGTATRFLKAIELNGLLPSGRHHVHLSTSYGSAVKVGVRHGIPVVLKIDSARMFMEGFKFYLSNNGVWLTDSVLPKYFTVLKTTRD